MAPSAAWGVGTAAVAATAVAAGAALRQSAFEKT